MLNTQGGRDGFGWEMSKIDQFDVEQFGTLDRREKTIAISGTEWP